MTEAEFTAQTGPAVRSALEKALRLLRDNDRYLLDKNAHERTICGRLAFHLTTAFSGFNVDIEYNRKREDKDGIVKRLRGSTVVTKIRELRQKRELSDDDTWMLNQVEKPNPLTVLPDIVVHIRDTNDFNLLVIEAKNRPNDDDVNREIDRLKLKAYREEFGYKFSARIVFPTDEAIGNTTDVAPWLEFQG